MSPAQSGTMYTSAVAAGGRYDGLLKSLWSPAAATIMPAPGAVGVSINCEKLIRTLLQRGQHKGGHGYMQGAVGGLPGALGLQGGRLQTGQCDVLVCAKGGDGMLQVGRINPLHCFLFNVVCWVCTCRMLMCNWAATVTCWFARVSATS